MRKHLISSKSIMKGECVSGIYGSSHCLNRLEVEVVFRRPWGFGSTL